MKADAREWRKLPKFIIAERDIKNEGGDDEPFQASFVTHCHEPRFMMRFVWGFEDELFLIDSTDDEEHLALLKRKAREFFLETHPILKV